jgi:twitching motility protein PilT
MIAAQEIMINNTAIANLIRENQINQINNVIQTHKQEGMQLLEDHLIELISKGLINIEEALTVANNPQYVLNEIKNRGIVI